MRTTTDRFSLLRMKIFFTRLQRLLSLSAYVLFLMYTRDLNVLHGTDDRCRETTHIINFPQANAFVFVTSWCWTLSRKSKYVCTWEKRWEGDGSGWCGCRFLKIDHRILSNSSTIRHRKWNSWCYVFTFQFSSQFPSRNDAFSGVMCVLDVCAGIEVNLTRGGG